MGILVLLILMFVLLIIGIFGLIWKYYQTGRINKRVSIIISSLGFVLACFLLVWVISTWGFYVPSV